MAEKEYIERGALLNKLVKLKNDPTLTGGQEIGVALSIREFLQIPSADVVEVKHGKWIHDYNNVYGCSECLERETMSPKKPKNYCPNCGAKMDGGAE